LLAAFQELLALENEFTAKKAQHQAYVNFKLEENCRNMPKW